MVDVTAVEMDEQERDEFLGAGGTGVISFAGESGETPDSIPISYGYDRVEQDFYFQIAAGIKHSKTAIVDRAVTFVTYGQTEAGWRSVIASGRLEDVEEESIATDTLAGLERVDIPLIDMFGVPPREVQFGFYRLNPDRLTGRKEAKMET